MLPLLTEHRQKLELLILDNASSDSTQSVVDTFLGTLPRGLSIKSFRHQHNIGMSENILACVERSSGVYFMFIGDDDKVHPEGLRTILELLENGATPSSIIQGVWPAYGIIWDQTQSVEPEIAVDYFFFAGNASAAVSRTSFLKEALESFRTQERLEGNIWPQTFLIFHAIFSHPENPPLITSFPHGAMINERWIVRPDKKYTLRIIDDLLDISIHLKRALGTAPQPYDYFTGQTLNFFEVQIRALISRSLRDLDPASTFGLFWKLGVNKIPIPLTLRIRMVLTRFPRGLLVLTVLDLFARGGLSLASRFLRELHSQRLIYQAEVRSANDTGLRVRDFC